MHFKTEIFQLNLKLVENNKYHPLFSKSQIGFNLFYDKNSLSFSVFQTAFNHFYLSQTDNLSENVFYKRESVFPRQFKSISAFYGTINANFINKTIPFVRAFINFSENTQHLYAFIRYQNTLFHVRPKMNNFNIIKGVHEIVEIVNGLDDKNRIFTFHSASLQKELLHENQSMFLQNINNKTNLQQIKLTENKYCSKYTY